MRSVGTEFRVRRLERIITKVEYYASGYGFELQALCGVCVSVCTVYWEATKLDKCTTVLYVCNRYRVSGSGSGPG